MSVGDEQLTLPSWPFRSILDYVLLKLYSKLHKVSGILWSGIQLLAEQVLNTSDRPTNRIRLVLLGLDSEMSVTNKTPAFRLTSSRALDLTDGEIMS